MDMPLTCKYMNLYIQLEETENSMKVESLGLLHGRQKPKQNWVVKSKEQGYEIQ